MSLTIISPGGGGDLVDDLTPQLGGDLDAQGFNITDIEYLGFDPAIVPPVHTEGLLFYDPDNKCFTAFNDRSTPSLQLGRESWFRGYNDTGVTIPDGSVVYINGETGGEPTIALAQADLAATSISTIAIATEDILDGESGECTVFGKVRGLDTSSYTAGDVIYLSPTTPGGFTSTKPVSPNYIIIIGTVSISHASDGTVEVNVDKGENTSSLNELFNGATLDSTTVTVDSDGATITLSWEKSGGGDIDILFDGAFTTFDATPIATVALTPGTDTVPVENYVYVLESTGLLTASTAGWPVAQHAPVATVVCQSAATLQTKKAMKVHAWTDHIKDSTDMGHLSDINFWIRNQHATWSAGIDQTLTITPGSPDTVIFTTASGTILQLHDHTMPAFSGTPDIYVKNDSVTPYTIITDLASALTDSTGASMSGSYFSLVIWGVVSEDTGDCKLFLNLPGGSYGTEAALLDDAQQHADYTIPRIYKGTGFLISELKLRHQAAGGGTWTSIQEVDLRGSLPGTGVGGGLGGGVTDHGGLTGLTDDDHTIYALLAGRSGGQVYIGATGSGEVLTFRSTSHATKGVVLIEGPQFADPDDATKKQTHNVSAIAAATTRTVTWPNADVTIANLANKTGDTFTGIHDFGGATSLEIPNADASVGATDGLIAIDTTVADWSHGILEYYSGEVMAVVSMPVANLTTPTDKDALFYNATNDEFELRPLVEADISDLQAYGVSTGDTWTGVHDFGGATSLEIPNSATPTVNADGEIALDTTVTDFSHGIIKFYGGEEQGIVSMPIAQFTTPTDGDTLSYNATNDEFEMVQPSGGDWIKISQATASASATIEFTGLNSTYRAYKVIITYMRPATDATSLYIRTSTDGGSTYDSGGSDYSYTNGYIGSAYTVAGATTASAIIGSAQHGNGTNEFANLEVTIFNPSQVDHTHIYAAGTAFTTSFSFTSVMHLSGKRLSAADVDAIEFSMSSGNIAEGVFTLYGIKD